MDRMRRIAGMGKPKVPSAVQKDKDESIVFFRELYKREKDRDVNLLEPMYSVEFDAVQGGHACKIPSGKRDFLIPVDEKHDYDWLKTPPATPLFPSLEIESNSSQVVFQKELAIPPRQVKPSASWLSGKPEATKTSARLASPTVNSSSKNNIVKGAPAISKEKNQPYNVVKRSSQKVRMDGQQKSAATSISATRISGATKKHSDRCYASQTGSTSVIKGVKARSKDPGSGADVKKENGKTRRQSCPPAVTRGMKELQLEGRQNAIPPRGKSVTPGGSESASNIGGRAGKVTPMKGTRGVDGMKEHKPELGSQAKK